ncbi:MAG: DUF1456 family protein [Candidatus Delongbacteria bacterium]|jgi:uncharacterized protein YehS (DUF1456 family)|nr:DUF1456 family protein [Candidatus Delongbacteria bacterium]
MLNNDILRRIRYTFDFEDLQMIKIFGLADLEVTRAQVSNWMKKDDDEDYQPINDKIFATFLNGLINLKRGNREGKQPEPEKKLTNNIILMKLKIALNLKSDEILDVLSIHDIRISEHELSAFFRKPGHKHFRECKDQILRNFLKGIQVQYRGKD